MRVKVQPIGGERMVSDRLVGSIVSYLPKVYPGIVEEVDVFPRLGADYFGESNGHYKSGTLRRMLRRQPEGHAVLAVLDGMLGHDEKGVLKIGGAEAYMDERLAIVPTRYFDHDQGSKVVAPEWVTIRTSLHEVGHLIGLDHCYTTQGCLMWNGEVDFVSWEKSKKNLGDTLCKYCKSDIGMKA